MGIVLLCPFLQRWIIALRAFEQCAKAWVSVRQYGKDSSPHILLEKPSSNLKGRDGKQLPHRPRQDERPYSVPGPMDSGFVACAVVPDRHPEEMARRNERCDKPGFPRRVRSHRWLQKLQCRNTPSLSAGYLHTFQALAVRRCRHGASGALRFPHATKPQADRGYRWRVLHRHPRNRANIMLGPVAGLHIPCQVGNGGRAITRMSSGNAGVRNMRLSSISGLCRVTLVRVGAIFRSVSCIAGTEPSAFPRYR